MTAAHQWWGPWFPKNWFGPWFPDGVPDATIIQPPTPGGAATFLLLESGSKITLSYATDQKKMWSGREYRAQFIDDPKRKFVGNATLLGDDTRTMRARLARYAAIGSTFLLALPFEAISITGDASGTTIPTTDTTHSDWMQAGQRVAISNGFDIGGAIDAVVQSFTANSITIEVDPGSLGRNGCVIMPTIPVFFDPTMTFTRFRGRGAVEQWQLSATAAVFGFPVYARAAFTSLAAATGALHSLVIAFPNSGPAANGFSLTFVADGTGVGSVTITTLTALVFHYETGVTTVPDLMTALAAFNTFMYFGSYSPTMTFTAGDAIVAVFSGGTLANNGLDMGQGATVATYDDRPVWDRRIQVQDTASDSIQSLAELVDLGGLPISIGTANQADWGRALYMQRTDRDEWQWLKKFLATVRGAQRAFWLPSFRPDLIAVTGPDQPTLPGFYSVPPTNGDPYSPRITIRTGEASGDVFAWFPNQRDRLFIRQVNGFTAMVRIESIEDFGDGTAELTLDWFAAPALPDPTSPIDLVCWLELVRFDSSDFEVTWDHGTFTMQTKARVVQQ